jgi:hypothetical protein
MFEEIDVKSDLTLYNLHAAKWRTKGWIQPRYTINTFVSVTMYLQYNYNMLINKKFKSHTLPHNFIYFCCFSEARVLLHNPGWA